jgi:hypothetical protein
MKINSLFILANKRDKIITLHAIKPCGRSGCISPLILIVRGQLHDQFALTSVKENPVPTNYETVWDPVPVWKF